MFPIIKHLFFTNRLPQPVLDIYSYRIASTLQEQIQKSRPLQTKELVQKIFNFVCLHRDKDGLAGYLFAGEFNLSGLIALEVDGLEALAFSLYVHKTEIQKLETEYLGEHSEEYPQFGTNKINFKITFHLADKDKLELNYHQYFSQYDDCMNGGDGIGRVHPHVRTY